KFGNPPPAVGWPPAQTTHEPSRISRPAVNATDLPAVRSQPFNCRSPSCNDTFPWRPHPHDLASEHARESAPRVEPAPLVLGVHERIDGYRQPGEVPCNRATRERKVGARHNEDDIQVAPDAPV